MHGSRWRLAASLAAVLAIGTSQLRAQAQDKVIKVTAEKFKFTPSVIELKLGQPTVLELTSLDRKHGFLVVDLKIDETIEPGKVTRVRIMPDKAGTFPFHCDAFCGSGHEGMTGEIVVKP